MAAPTAGLHFTQELLQKIRDKGVEIAYLTLYVGLGTFRPVKVEDIKTHKMHSEFYEINEETAKIVNETKEKGGRIISVGTTSTRTLETAGMKQEKYLPATTGQIFLSIPVINLRRLIALLTIFICPNRHF